MRSRRNWDERTRFRRSRRRRGHAGGAGAAPPRARAAGRGRACRPSSLPAWPRRPGRRAGRARACGRPSQGAAFLLAAGVAAAAFGIGFLVGDRGGDQFRRRRRRSRCTAVAAPTRRGASIQVGDRDRVGNWPLPSASLRAEEAAEGPVVRALPDRERARSPPGAARSRQHERPDGRAHVRARTSSKGVNWVVTTSERKRRPADPADDLKASRAPCGRSRRTRRA